MKVVDVLKGATSSIANRFGFHDKGRIEVGNKVDLVFAKGDVRELLAKEENSLFISVWGIERWVAARVYKEMMH
jgi:hypothetical protein